MLLTLLLNYAIFNTTKQDKQKATPQTLESETMSHQSKKKGKVSLTRLAKKGQRIMRKLTVAEMREKEIRNASEKYGIEYKELKTMMNRYYRLCGAYERLLYLENDERTCNSSYTTKLSEQTENRYFKLNDNFKKYGLEMKFFGYIPTICEIKTTATAIERHFYN